MAANEKKAGTTYNVKLGSAEAGPDGKRTWTLIGKCFIRADGTGGALFVGEGETERTYALFPKEGWPKAKQGLMQKSPTAKAPVGGL